MTSIFQSLKNGQSDRVRQVEFHRRLNDENALRVRFGVDRGQVVEFVVQLECRFVGNEKWVPVVRYDTAHDFAHCDRLHPYEPTTKEAMVTNNYNEALDIAMNDLLSRWSEYRRRYERWLRKK